MGMLVATLLGGVGGCIHIPIPTLQKLERWEGEGGGEGEGEGETAELLDPLAATARPRAHASQSVPLILTPTASRRAAAIRCRRLSESEDALWVSRSRSG